MYARPSIATCRHRGNGPWEIQEAERAGVFGVKRVARVRWQTNLSTSLGLTATTNNHRNTDAALVFPAYDAHKMMVLVPVSLAENVLILLSFQARRRTRDVLRA